MDGTVKRKHVARIVGALAIAAGILTLSVTGGLPPPTSMVPIDCVFRSTTGPYNSANVWQGKNVCQQGERAISAGGQCPGNMRGTSVSSGISSLGIATYLLCTGTGTAEWNATCCQMWSQQ